MAKQKQVSQHDIEQAWMEAFIERHGGRISPKILVEEASDPSCPLHDRFEWDDDVAARHDSTADRDSRHRARNIVGKKQTRAAINVLNSPITNA